MVYTGNDVRVLLSPCGIPIDILWGIEVIRDICCVVHVVLLMAQQTLVQAIMAKGRVVQALAMGTCLHTKIPCSFAVCHSR